MMTKPRFDIRHFPSHQRTGWGPHNNLALRYETKLYNLTGIRDLSQEVKEIISGLRYLMALKDVNIATGSVSLEEFERHSIEMECLETQVIAILLDPHVRSVTSKDPSQNRYLIYSLFANAYFIHDIMFFKGDPLRLLYSNIFSLRIRESLQGLDDKQKEKLAAQYPEMMLWILLMGGIGGIGTKDHGWFVGGLADLCSKTGLNGSQEIGLALEEFVWTEMYTATAYKRFWNQIAVLQGTPGLQGKDQDFP